MVEATRAPQVQAFLDALSACLAGCLVGNSEDAAFAERLFSKLTSPALPGKTVAGSRLEACRYLKPALDRLRDAPLSTQRLGQALAALDPFMPWSQRPYHGPDADRFAAGHANGLIVGPGGMEDRDDIRVGVSLMAPNIRYPDHSHPPDELYFVLSDGEWRRGEGEWFRPGVGGTVRNPPGILHAMRSGPAPLLAVWALIA
ncbi:MAG TPA: dimethylsulfonioproprionate lyase family protein [Stellaceae bacterium]|nr:dimethylsulfonioproprionate lyase family protein [Stellaceae bacterium]